MKKLIISGIASTFLLCSAVGSCVSVAYADEVVISAEEKIEQVQEILEQSGMEYTEKFVVLENPLTVSEYANGVYGSIDTYTDKVSGLSGALTRGRIILESNGFFGIDMFTFGSDEEAQEAFTAYSDMKTNAFERMGEMAVLEQKTEENLQQWIYRQREMSEGDNALNNLEYYVEGSCLFILESYYSETDETVIPLLVNDIYTILGHEMPYELSSNI